MIRGARYHARGARDAAGKVLLLAGLNLCIAGHALRYGAEDTARRLTTLVRLKRALDRGGQRAVNDFKAAVSGIIDLTISAEDKC